MAYIPTAYLYLFYKNKKELNKRINIFHDYLEKMSDFETRKECGAIEELGCNNQIQFIVKSSHGEDAYTVFEEGLLFCCEIDFEADVRNPLISNYNYAKNLIYGFLKNKVIDVARLYLPEGKGRVFHYIGLKRPLCLFLAQFLNKGMVAEHVTQYRFLISKLYYSEEEQEIIEFSSTYASDFLMGCPNDLFAKFQ